MTPTTPPLTPAADLSARLLALSAELEAKRQAADNPNIERIYLGARDAYADAARLAAAPSLPDVAMPEHERKAIAKAHAEIDYMEPAEGSALVAMRDDKFTVIPQNMVEYQMSVREADAENDLFREAFEAAIKDENLTAEQQFFALDFFKEGWESAVRILAAPERSDTPWHDAVLAECMRVESCYKADDPVASLAALIDWHAHSSDTASTNKALADNYLKLTCSSKSTAASKALDAAAPAGLTNAARDVLAERSRQVEQEGWAPEHDKIYDEGELSRAASCYALAGDGPYVSVPEDWPWNYDWWKPTDDRRNLVKAGALILADIERLDRIDGDKQGAQGDA